MAIRFQTQCRRDPAFLENLAQEDMRENGILIFTITEGGVGGKRRKEKQKRKKHFFEFWR